MRRHVFTSEKTELQTVAFKIWYIYQKNGDFVHLYRSLGLLYRIFEDGTVCYSCKINTNLRDPVIGSIDHNLIAYGSTFYRMDRSIAARREVVVTSMPLAILNGPERSMWLEKESKLLYVDNFGYISIYTIIGDTTVTGPISVGNIDQTQLSGWKQLTPYKPGQLFAYNKVNGRIAILNTELLLSGLDAEAAKIFDSAIGDSFDYVWYNPWNKQFHGITESMGTVTTYTDLIQPDQLGNPFLVDEKPGGLHPVQGTRLRVLVTSTVIGKPGKDYEVVEGWLVDWNLIGLGALQRSQSKTDKDGNAENYYFGPLTGAGLPATAQIDASVLD